MFKEESVHFTLSILAGLLVYFLTGNAWAVAVAPISGFFIDADHLFDYFLFRKFKDLSIKDFLSSDYFNKSGKVILPFHGYEYGLTLIVIGFFIQPLDWLFWSLGLSLFAHLVYDTSSNKPIWPTYFILYRLLHRFNHDDFDFKKGQT